ncbi:MFS transporter [Nonomuraea sp. B5E05]|uniref:MFS transporter n=1 Tax=Nonomuraea sp. B5E05 TaxID=3153569 RepID=UPI0032609940
MCSHRIIALGFDARHLAWVGNAYAPAFGGLLLLGGRLADLDGHRRVFTAASLSGGLADTPGALIAARAGQGVGAAVLAPATLTILMSSFPASEEDRTADGGASDAALGGQVGQGHSPSA